MLLKEFLEFIRPGQKICINKGSLRCTYQMQNDRTNKFYNFNIEGGMYENLENKTIEGILLESEINTINSNLYFEHGKSADSSLSIDLKYISVESLIRDLTEKEKENGDEEVRFSIYNKYQIVSENVANETLYKAEVMFYNKDDSGKYNIFIDCELEEYSDNTNLNSSNGPFNPNLPPNLSGANPHLRVAAKAFDHLYETSTGDK